uniref:non-specific serine/threonine protein kinase n=1 Tax=Oncorhynchus kisutch TaxID=8019 RepID=A0A8C7K423_ONCKI
ILIYVVCNAYPFTSLLFSENIAHLAETALRFLELVQENNLNMEHDLNGEDKEETLHPNENYDSELQALHEMVQQKVVTLLSDSENIVKQSLMENGITRLCVFFRPNDWHLRGAFFDSIVGVAAYVGWQSSSILKPLLQQGLSDAEEFVIYKALNSLTCMCQLGLLQKPHIYEFVSDIAPFLCHPNLWIRYGAVGFITVVAQHLNIAVYCKLMPHLNPFITQPIIQIDKEIVLLSVLKEPVSRSIFDYSLRSSATCCCGRRSAAAHSQNGMTEAEEDKLLALKDFMLKSNKAKANMGDQSHLGEAVQSGVIDLATLGIMGRQVDLVKPKQEAEDKRDFITTASARKHTKQDSNMNEEWKSMFGSQESAATVPEGAGTQTRKTTASLGVPVGQSAGAVSTYQRRLNTCKAELQHLVQQKREQCSAERMAKQMMESAEWESRPPPPGWHPKGLLVAHLHEHKSAVNRIRVSDEHSIFATASNDGTVKVWDSQKMEGKTTTTRSVLTYSRIGGHVKTLTFCQGSHYLAAASDNGSIQLLAIEANKSPKSPKVNPFQTRLLHQKDDGCVVDVHHFNSGAQSVLAYATVNGSLVGWDLRSNSNAWTLRHDLHLGLITSFTVDMHQSCGSCVVHVVCMKILIFHHNLQIKSLKSPTIVSLIWAATGMPTAGKGTIWAAYAPNIGYSLFHCGHRQIIHRVLESLTLAI